MFRTNFVSSQQSAGLFKNLNKIKVMEQSIFFKEIKNILATNGDKLKPSNDTVVFVDNLFCEEMALIVREILFLNRLRHDAKIIEILDILTLLNNNVDQVQRLLKWLKSRSLSLKHVSSLQSDILEIDISGGLLDKKDKLVPKMAKIYENGQKHISKLYENKELTDRIINCELEDSTLKDREMKVDIISLRLSLDDYLIFQEMKTNKQNKENLKLWLSQYGINNNELESSTDSFNFIMEDQIFDVIAYLCKEVILCLIDQIYKMYYDWEVGIQTEEEINKEKRHKIMEHIIKRTLSVGITVKDVKEAYRRFHFRPIHPSIVKAEDLEIESSLSEMNERRKLLLLDS